ncbi:hypothetical protein M407DRAFT_215913 [Tulasnella calospora MUT 4182]|uniref:F-box domain-containing protein n=1 Tax=Tulasnella calospora MUT 4182 TaxID=1051891 RepID=A0A0C3LDT6_9AGAM|nr:hypothetical protein M407DRAFT_215913 [Tulasnella calospora MUT 4182]
MHQIITTTFSTLLLESGIDRVQVFFDIPGYSTLSSSLKAIRTRAYTRNAKIRHYATAIMEQGPTTSQSSTALISQRRSFRELPEDILVLIIDALALHDKTCLVRTCQYIRNQVEPLLYRHLCSTIVPEYRYWDYARLFTTLLARPELIQHAHSYKGPLTPYCLYKDDEESFKFLYRLESRLTTAERIEIATTVFTQAVNIRDVHFTQDMTCKPTDLWEPVSQILFNKKLKRLAVDYFVNPVPVAALLRTQTELKRLEISSDARGSQDIDETHLPVLEHLECTSDQAASMVPGRPVRTLKLGAEENERVLGEELFQQLALSTGPITELVVQFPYEATFGIFQNTLQYISRYLPKVKSLTIRVNGFMSGEVLLGEIPSFKHLKHLQLWQTWLSEPMIKEETPDGRPRRAEEEDWEVLISRAKELCPTLVELKYNVMSRPCFDYNVY